MKKLGTLRLETERLILRRFKLNDVENVYNGWVRDKQTTKYLSWNIHKNIEETEEIIRNWINEYENGYYHWVVELKQTGDLIGSISSVNINYKNNNLEIGYCYSSKYWGNGYATEALRRVIEFLLLECDVYLIETRHISGNPASGRVMEKAGMKKDGVLRNRRINKATGEYNDLIYYSITKDEL